jgi:hypothetical protein
MRRTIPRGNLQPGRHGHRSGGQGDSRGEQGPPARSSRENDPGWNQEKCGATRLHEANPLEVGEKDAGGVCQHEQRKQSGQEGVTRDRVAESYRIGR